MSDPYPFPDPPDVPQSGSLPGPRGASKPRSQADDPTDQISLEEMMERLRHSGGSGSHSGSGSGRRRRRSSQEGGSSSRREGYSARPPQQEEDEDSFRSFPGSDGGHSSRSSHESGRSYRHSSRSSGGSRKLPKVSFDEAPARSTSESRKMLWIMGSLAAVLVLVGGGFAGVRLLNRARVEGDGFRVNVARRVSEIVDRRVAFPSRFREADRYSVGTASMAVAPVFEDLLETAEFTDLMIKLTPGSWTSDDWSLTEVRSRGISLTFQPVKVMDFQRVQQSSAAPVDRGPRARQGGFRMGMTADPASISLETGQFESLNLSWPGPGGKPETLSKLEGNLRMMDGVMNVEARDGVLDTAAWPPLPLEQINVRLKGTTMEIVSARVGLAGKGTVRLTGKAEMVPDGRLDLTADIQPVPLKEILPEFWGSHVSGDVSSNGAKWVSQFKSGPPAEFSGAFVTRGVVLQGLAFVDKIANMLRQPDLTLMQFADFRGNFSWTAQRVRISEITAQSQDNFLKLSGWLEIVPGESSVGKFRVEASEVYFAGLPGGPPALFSKSGEGFYAMEFEISGRGNLVQDSIPVEAPVMMQRGPDLPRPRMTLPPGVAAPKPAAPAQPSATESSAPAAFPPAGRAPATIEAPSLVPSGTLLPPSPAPEKSPEELEREFNKLIGR